MMIPLYLAIQYIDDHNTITDMSKQTHEHTAHNAPNRRKNNRCVNGLIDLIGAGLGDQEVAEHSGHTADEDAPEQDVHVAQSV
jgi:hypothetical protein